MSYSKITLYLIFSSMLLSCGSMPPPAMDADRARDYNQPLTVMFDAAKMVLSALNAEIIQSDNAGGILVAKKHLGGELVMAILIGKSNALFAIYRLNFLYREGGTRILLRIVSVFGDGSHEQEFYKSGYDQFWIELEKALARS